MKRQNSVTVVAVDLFYTAFAVMFILEATKRSGSPKRTPSEKVSVSVPWEPAHAADDCLVYLEIAYGDSTWATDLQSNGTIEDDLCRFEIEDEISRAQLAHASATVMVLRYPRNLAQNQVVASINVGETSVPVVVESAPVEVNDLLP